MSSAAEGEVHALAPVARLFAQLVLKELDERMLDVLRGDDVAAALRDVGVRLPEPANVDALAAEFFEAFVRPQTGAPPVESLWREGQFEGKSTAMVRKLAAAAGLQFDRDAARGAPPDHLGNLLLLWCETEVAMPAVAERVARDHLAFAARALSVPARGEGFYAEVAAATEGLVARIRAAYA